MNNEDLIITRLINISSQLLEEKDNNRALRLNSAITILNMAMNASDANAKRLLNVSSKLLK